MHTSNQASTTTPPCPHIFDFTFPPVVRPYACPAGLGLLLQHLGLRGGALQVLVQVGQAGHFLDVDVVNPVEALGALPLPVPVLRVRHRVLDLELLPLAHQFDPLDDA